MVMRNGPVIRAPAFYNDGTNYQLQNAQGIENINHVKFPATQVASSDVNALDDYEEGTWTPAIADDESDGSGEGQTYSVPNQVGRYTKIGNRVFFNFRLTVTSIGSLTGEDLARIVGLPFTSNSTANSDGAVVAGFASGLTSSTAGFNLSGTVIVNGTYIRLRTWDTATGASSLTVTEVGASANIYMGGHYEV
jgi:hypothetical protein